MSAVLISIKPQWCELIANGKKTIEVRKSRPRLKTPFKCYIYCTKAKPAWFRFSPPARLDGMVIGEFVCDGILDIQSRGIYDNYDYCFESLNCFGNDDIEPYITAIKKSRTSKKDLNEYSQNAKHLYGWHISDLKIYDKPKELSEFSRFGFAGMGNSEYVCGRFGCEYFIPSTDYDEPPECKLNGCTLMRPPQSWCYVKEQEESK